MRLGDYLERTGESQADFAKRAGLAQSVVSRVVSGRDASGENWARISAATGGRVQPKDHFPPDEEDKDDGSGPVGEASAA